MDNAAGLAVMGAVGIIVLRGMTAGCDAYGAFIKGAREGLRSAVGLLPALCAMLMMLSLMTSSGVTEALTRLLAPVLRVLNLPEEVAPMVLLRPLTGSGSMSVLQQIFTRCGPDSRAGRAASILMGSSETIVYTLSVYLSQTGVKKLPQAVSASVVSYIVNVIVCGLLV